MIRFSFQRLLIFFCAILAWSSAGIFTNTDAAETWDRNQIQAEVAKTMKRMEEISFRYEEVLQRVKGPIYKREGRCHISIPRKRCYCAYTEKNTDDTASQPGEIQILYESGQHVNIQHNAISGMEWGGMASLDQEYTDQDIVLLSGWGNLLGYGIGLKDRPMSAVYPLDQFLREAVFEEVADERDENSVHIRGTQTTEGVTFSVLFDPHSPFLWTKIDRSFELPDSPGQIYQDTYEAFDFHKVEDIYLPSRIRTERNIVRNQNGTLISESKGHTEIQLSDYRLSNTESDFRLTDVPDATPISVEGSPQIAYMWLDGEVVPQTDEAMLALASGHKFMPGVGEPRFWLMAVGLMMLLIGGGILLRRHLKSEA